MVVVAVADNAAAGATATDAAAVKKADRGHLSPRTYSQQQLRTCYYRKYHRICWGLQHSQLRGTGYWTPAVVGYVAVVAVAASGWMAPPSSVLLQVC